MTDLAPQDAYWEDQLHRDVDHPVVEGFARQRWEHLARLLPLDEIHSALDVGGGTGFSSHFAPNHMRCVSCDLSRHVLSRSPVRRRLQADALSLPFAGDSFDLVFCWEVLHHLASPYLALKEMGRVSGRFVVVFEPNPFNPGQLVFSLIDREHRRVLRYTKQYMLEQVERAGLKTLSFHRGGLIFPNRTPRWLFGGLRALPYRLPLVGITQLVVASKP
jgi:SAM-dependent methyltransferase